MWGSQSSGNWPGVFRKGSSIFYRICEGISQYLSFAEGGGMYGFLLVSWRDRKVWGEEPAAVWVIGVGGTFVRRMLFTRGRLGEKLMGHPRGSLCPNTTWSSYQANSRHDVARFCGKDFSCGSDLDWRQKARSPRVMGHVSVLNRVTFSDSVVHSVEIYLLVVTWTPLQGGLA